VNTIVFLALDLTVIMRQDDGVVISDISSKTTGVRI
jgi:hypothetical protein